MPLQLTFVTSAKRHVDLPDSRGEVAFVGRSNAGKSTAINALTQQKRLAFASKTPGRTQHINLFELGPKLSAWARRIEALPYFEKTTPPHWK